MLLKGKNSVLYFLLKQNLKIQKCQEHQASSSSTKKNKQHYFYPSTTLFLPHGLVEGPHVDICQGSIGIWEEEDWEYGVMAMLENINPGGKLA